jgi:hypothetical protein
MPTIARARSRLVDDFQRQATKPQVSPFDYCLAFEHIYEFEARRRELETRGVVITDRDAIKLFSKSLPESYKPFVDAHAECDIWAEFHFNYRGQTLQIAKSTASPNVMFLPPEYHHDWIPRSQYLRDNPQYWNRYGGQATSSTPPVLGAEPANLEEAMASPEWPQWERAMHTHTRLHSGRPRRCDLPSSPWERLLLNLTGSSSASLAATVTLSGTRLSYGYPTTLPLAFTLSIPQCHLVVSSPCASFSP